MATIPIFMRVCRANNQASRSRALQSAGIVKRGREFLIQLSMKPRRHNRTSVKRRCEREREIGINTVSRSHSHSFRKKNPSLHSEPYLATLTPEIVQSMKRRIFSHTPSLSATNTCRNARRMGKREAREFRQV